MFNFSLFRVGKSFIGFVMVILCVAFVSCKDDVSTIKPQVIQQLPKVDSVSNESSISSLINSAKAKVVAYACQCVDYIRNRFSALSSYRGNAKDWHSNLIKAGYAVTAYPQAGDVIVFQPKFGGVNATYGHIGTVVSYAYSYNAQTKVGTRTLWHRGANTGGSETECSCNNVKSSKAVYADDKVGYIAYYHK